MKIVWMVFENEKPIAVCATKEKAEEIMRLEDSKNRKKKKDNIAPILQMRQWNVLGEENE